MAVIEGGVSGAAMGVGVEAASAAHVQVKPIPHGALGHYRSAVRFSILASQGAATRLWEVRNTGTNLIIPTRLRVSFMQLNGAAGTAIRDSLQLFRDTVFSAVDTTNTVTPVASVKRTAGMAAAPGGAAIRHVTVAGNTAGMTGGTRTPDGGAASQVEMWLLATLPTAGPVPQIIAELLDDVNGTHPFVLANNEGLEIQNEVALGVNIGASVVVDFSWAEVTAY
jgi:hypothetical protein